MKPRHADFDVGNVMLVYANCLELEGDGYHAVVSSLSGWLKRKTNRTISISELSGNNKISIDGFWVTTVSASAESPRLYAITIKHPDSEVRGRQWVLEVGINVSSDKTKVSIVLRTDEISSLVSSEISATRPVLVRYISENGKLAAGTIGVSTSSVGESFDTYRALLYDIERGDRQYPIVLVSPDTKSQYPIDVNRLQELLLGLAQVVKVEEDFNSYEMEEVLGRRFSAWDGAINILHIPFRNGHVRSKLFKSKYLEDEFPSQSRRLGFILSSITHNTNIPNVRKQIRSESVRAKLIKERFQSQADKNEPASADDVSELLQLAADQEAHFRSDLERLELEKLEVEEERDGLDQKLSRARWSLEGLTRQLQEAGGDANNLDVQAFMDVACRADEPSPRECLDLMLLAYPGKIDFLESALDSSDKSTSFKRGRILLNMLNKLVVDYLPLYLHSGDNKARYVFTNKQYAANESETVENNDAMKRSRTFSYKSEDRYMAQHLKVGVADDAQRTIRVHFFVDTFEEKIVVGYCGEHLPLIGR